MSRYPAPLLFAASLLAPTLVLAQTTEHESVEIIHAPAFKAVNAKTPDATAVAKLIIEKTNDFRVKENRSRVTSNPKLTEAATGFAAYMAKEGRFGHTADGSRPSERAAKQGYEYCIVAENIAYTFDPAGFTSDELGKKLVEGWEKSPGHRRNMLDPDVTETGVAVAQSPTTGYFFAVQMFGRPKALALTFTVTNESAATVSYRIGESSFSLPPRYTRTHEQCRPTEVIFEGAGGENEKKEQTLKAENGSRFVLTGEEGKVQVKKELSPPLPPSGKR